MIAVSKASRNSKRFFLQTVVSVTGLLERLSQCSEATCPATVDDLVAYPDHKSAEQFGIDLDVHRDGLAVCTSQSRGELLELTVAERRRTAHVRYSTVADLRRQFCQIVQRVGRSRLA